MGKIALILPEKATPPKVLKLSTPPNKQATPLPSLSHAHLAVAASSRRPSDDPLAVAHELHRAQSNLVLAGHED